jgi:N6-adenosine-specific RNA methylase IME4
MKPAAPNTIPVAAQPELTALVPWDNARRALSEARTVYEAKSIRDIAVAMEVWAKQAKNHEMEADAIALRMNASRKLGQLMQAQKETVGLAKGGKPYQGKATGLAKNPVATLAMQGIDKNLAQQGRVFSALSKSDFERKVEDARDSVTRVFRRVVREVEIEHEREGYRARTYQGGTVADLEALIASGFRAGVIVPDFPWQFEVYSGKGKQRSAERHYDTWPLERIKEFAANYITRLAAKDCALLLWAVWPEHPGAHEVIKACGFEYKTGGFDWVKLNVEPDADGWVKLNVASNKGLHWGMGYATRANSEVCLLATRGSPRRLAADVHQVVLAPVGEHSAKPDEVYRRIERLYPGPCLELFARRERPGWTTWGNEIKREDM